MDTTTNVSALVRHIENAIPDDLNLLTRVHELFFNRQPERIEILSSLPASPDPHIVISYIERWKELRRRYNCEIRIFGWSHSIVAEKYILGLVQHMEGIYVTPLPRYLEGE